jgi:hypothetical protein
MGETLPVASIRSTCNVQLATGNSNRKGKPMPSTDEKQLVEQAKSDPRAFTRLYDRYLDRIYAYVYRQTRDEMVAQDVTAVTFEKALRNIRRHRWQGVSFRAWLYSIARNEIAQHYRQQKRLLDWRLPEPHSNGRLPETAVQQREREQKVHRALPGSTTTTLVFRPGDVSGPATISLRAEMKTDPRAIPLNITMPPYRWQYEPADER